MSSSETLLSARGVGFTTGSRALVRDASLSLELSRVTVIVGPNGAGKSTLFKLMTGELAPTTGEIAIDGAALPAIPGWELACRRAVMAQHARLSFPFAVHEVVRLGTDGVGRALDRRARDGLVADSLAAADVLPLAHRAYQTLSGGEQQRVQFARALCQLEAGRTVTQRQALFLDEPIASLDLNHQLAVLDFARRTAARGVAVAIVLHDLNLAATFADRLVVMSEGRIVAQGPPRAVLDDALLARVFGIGLALNRAPADGTPFLLPQQHREARPGQVAA